MAASMADPLAVVATIEPCVSLDELSAIRGQLKKLREERNFERDFMRNVFDKRDKQLFPRDLLAAFVPTRRSARGSAKTGAAGRRAVGILRRTLKVDKGRSSLHIDFVFVAREARGMQIGRRLLIAGLRFGKPKDVKLMVAGSDANVAAVSLYESVGFRWTSEQKTEMVLDSSRLPADGITAEGSATAAAQPPPAAEAARAEQPKPSRDGAGAAAVHSLCVDVGMSAGHGSGSWSPLSPGAAMAAGRAAPSGATPHLSMLRLSPRLSSGRFGSPALGSPTAPTNTPAAHSTSAHCSSSPACPSGTPLPSPYKVPLARAATEAEPSTRQKRRTQPLDHSPHIADAAEPAECSPGARKSVKAAPLASPRSPGRRFSHEA